LGNAQATFIMFSKIAKSEIVNFDAKARLFWLYVLFIAYLVLATGIASDDFAFIVSEGNNEGIIESIKSGTNSYLARPVFKYFYSIYYSLVDVDDFGLIDTLKVVQIVISFYMVTKFFSMFLHAAAAMMVSFLFIFFPTHDSTIYFFSEISLTLTIALYFYAYFLAHSRNRLISAGIISTVASFVSYGSPPVAFSLFVLCAVKRSYKKGLVLLIPNIIYCGYFGVVTILMNEDVKRLPEAFHIHTFLKQFVLQIGSFVDATIGPSFLLKMWYSILENTTISIIFGVLFVIGYIMISKSNNEKKHKTKVNKEVLIFLFCLTLFSLGMFAVTGYYPPIAFNLGNRTTIYGSLLVAYLIVTVPIPKNIRRGILLVFLVSIVGISAHWKQWNKHQMYVIENIRANKEMTVYDRTAPIYVSGNQYSKMGPFSHIEFLSENWVVDSVFKLAGHKKISARSLNKHFGYENGTISGSKYNDEFSVGNTVMVYDSEADQLVEIAAQDLNSYIMKLPDYKRHWVQLIKNEQLNALILKLMPRLQYAF